MKRYFGSARVQLIVLFVGGILLLGLIPMKRHIDPTAATFGLEVRNDTSRVVILKQCGNDCRSFHKRVRLAPGTSAAENASDESDVTQWFLVTDASDHPLGCIGLRFDRKLEGLVIPVSHMGGCRQELFP